MVVNPQAIAHKDRGNAHAQKGEYALALAEYDAALKEEPTYPQAWFNKGLM